MKFIAIVLIFLSACATKPKKPVEPEVQPVNAQWMEENAGIHNRDVLNCYMKRLKTKPKLEGQFRLEFNVNPAGEMRDAKIAKSLDPEFDLCVFNEAVKWKFPWNVRGQKGNLPVMDTFTLSFENGQPRSSYVEQQTGMDPEEIRKTIADNIKDVRFCYEDRLRDMKHPNLNGKLIVEWDVWENGYAHDVRVKQPFDAIVDQCIVTKLKTWQFPIPPKGMVSRVSYPFVFSNEDKK